MLKKALILYFLLGLLFGGVVSLSAKEQKDKSQWENHLEFSHVITTGNTNTITLSAKLDIAKEGDRNRYFIKGNALYGEDDDEETKNKWSLDTRWERIFTKRLFGLLSANYLVDKFSGYDYRIAGGPGLGYDIVKTKKHKLKGLISSLFYYDKFSDGIESSESYISSDSYISGKAEMDYTWQILENLKLDQILNYLVSSEDNKKYFMDSETALKVKVNKHISLGISYVIAYQNIPPTDKKHTDTTFLTSLIVDF